jgi:hypothetical protein
VKAVGDLDGDGRSDLVWQHSDGSAAIWLMNGLASSAMTLALPAGTGWTVRALGDYNADGKSDVLWAHVNGSVAVWLMNGVTPASGTVVLGSGTGWRPVP